MAWIETWGVLRLRFYPFKGGVTPGHHDDRLKIFIRK